MLLLYVIVPLSTTLKAVLASEVIHDGKWGPRVSHVIEKYVRSQECPDWSQQGSGMQHWVFDPTDVSSNGQYL